MTAPADTRATQREEALATANRVYAQQAEIRKDLRDRAITIHDALHDSRAQRMTIHALLVAQRGWGDIRARNLLARLQITETKRVQDLTARQVAVLERYLRPR